FEAISDPLPLHLQEVEAPSQLARVEARRQLLFIGSINRRKGLLETLRALECLPDPLKASVHLRIVGRFLDSDLRDEAVSKVNALVEHGYSIELSEGWVSDAQFALESQQCDLVLAPYVGFHGSSGVIGHAAFFAKPLLATCDGLVGEIVRERCLGEVVQTRDPVLYAAAILSFVNQQWNYAPQQSKYASRMSSSAFMQQLLNQSANSILKCKRAAKVS
ncbi:MAG: glycosyltransferase, partial [Lentimonas sp.]